MAVDKKQSLTSWIVGFSTLLLMLPLMPLLYLFGALYFWTKSALVAGYRNTEACDKEAELDSND